MKIAKVVSILCIGLMLSGQSYDDGDLDAAFDRGLLVISASEHACYVFDVYVAMSREQHSRGLMYVRYMPDSTGMLFVYRQSRVLSARMNRISSGM